VESSNLAVGGNGSGVNLDVGNLAPENIGGSPGQAVCAILVPVKYPGADKVLARLDDGHAARVANHLRVVVVDNRFGNKVCARREIDQSGRFGAACAARATAVAVADGKVDGLGVVSDAITLGSIILHIAEDLVARCGVGGNTLMGDLAQPVVGASRGSGAGAGRACRRS